MIKDILESFVKELQDTKNQDNLRMISEPFLYKFKISFYVVLFILLIITGNLSYISFMIHNSSRNINASI